MAGHPELERKYDADTGFAVPVLDGIPGCARVGGPEAHTLNACYFDTEDLRLASRGITLRRRLGGSDAGWHLKLAVAAYADREVHAPLDGTGRTVPVSLASLVAAHVRGDTLTAVAELETRRITRRLLAEDGRLLAEVNDDTVTARRLVRGEVRLMAWREIEVEAVTCSGKLLDAIGERLLNAGARASATTLKLERVLGDDVVRSGRSSSTTAGDLLVAYLDDNFEQLLIYDPQVRMADHDDDSVHRMRVATRRMRSLLRTHIRMLDRTRAEALEGELKWLADALGDVRDLEVLRARFHEQIGELPGAHQAPAWLDGMAATERRAREQIGRTLLTQRYMNLLDALDAFLAAPPLTARAARAADEETPEFVSRAWRKMLRRYSEAERLPAGDGRDTAMHRTRKAAKRARYTAEAAAPALGDAARTLARRAARLQEVLGVHQDGVTAAEYLSRVALRPGIPAEDVFVLGRLTELQRRRGMEALRGLPSAAKKAARLRSP